MKILIFTSNGTRHKYFANTLASYADEALVISEAKPYNLSFHTNATDEAMQQHFRDRYETEQKFFSGHDAFQAQTVPMMYKELRTPAAFNIVKQYNPDMALVFSASIIKDPILSYIPQGRFVNMHLGISPYYRGSGTNFWPFVNNEIEYVGATLHHLSADVDAGDIIAHVRPSIEQGDTAHTIGCKTIQAGIEGLQRCMQIVKSGKQLPRVPQWEVPDEKYYRTADFTREALDKYFENMESGMIEKFLAEKPVPPRLVTFD